MSGNLARWLLTQPKEGREEIKQAIVEADIARNAGRRDWWNVFRRYQDQSRGNRKKIYAALRSGKNGRALDVLWRELQQSN